jgi:AraC-like DNA-binding protein
MVLYNSQNPNDNMEYYNIPYPQAGSDEQFPHFLRKIGGEEEPGGDIHLSGTIARGAIRRFQLDAGLQMRVWDAVFLQPVLLRREGAPAHKESAPALQRNDMLSAIYILSPENITLKSLGHHQQFSRAWSRDVLLVSGDVPMELIIQSHRPVQIIDFSVSTHWFENQLRHSDTTKKAAQPLAEWHYPVIRIEPCSSRDTLVTNKLFQIAMHEKNDNSPLQALSSCMLTDLLRAVLHADVRKTPMYKDVYYEKIMKVEAILQEHLQKNLPPLAVIAQEVSLSESTLKRYFKIFFGTSVYDYYLQKKMHLAKGILLEKMMTVNEIADMMGYEKVSNFIDIFKKHHGFSPGAIKKRWMLTSVKVRANS